MKNCEKYQDQFRVCRVRSSDANLQTCPKTHGQLFYTLNFTCDKLQLETYETSQLGRRNICYVLLTKQQVEERGRGGVSSEINRPSLNRNPKEQGNARNYNSYTCHLNTYRSKWRASV